MASSIFFFRRLLRSERPVVLHVVCTAGDRVDIISRLLNGEAESLLPFHSPIMSFFDAYCHHSRFDIAFLLDRCRFLEAATLYRRSLPEYLATATVMTSFVPPSPREDEQWDVLFLGDNRRHLHTFLPFSKRRPPKSVSSSSAAVDKGTRTLVNQRLWAKVCCCC